MQPFLAFLLYSTLFLLAGGGAVGLLLRFSRYQSPAWNRFAWAVVLLLGVSCFRLPLEIPVLAPHPPLPASQAIAPAIVSLVPQPEGVAESPIPPRAWPELLRAHAVHLIFAVWFCGAALFFAAQLFFLRRAVRQAKDATIPESFFQSEWERLLAVYGLDSRKIELRTVDGAGPGLLRLPEKSIVVVPSAIWEEAPEHVRIGILKHEISHYRHNDLWKSLALRAVALLHWFNPMAHYAVRKFEEAAEWRCDADAFGSAEDAESAFAETMLLFRDTMPAAAAYRAAFSANNIKRRAERLIQFTQRKGDSLMKKTLILLCCAAMLLFGVFEIRLTAQSPAGSIETPDISQPNVVIEARVVLASSDFDRGALSQFGFGNSFDLSLLDVAIADGESKGHAKLISRTTIITPNNSPAADIRNGMRFPAVAAGDQDNTLSIKFYDAEQMLSVTPQITDDGNIMMDINFVVAITDSGYTSSGDAAPRISEIETSVQVSDGATAILGGILIEAGRGGDAHEMLIFITPTIVSPDISWDS